MALIILTIIALVLIYSISYAKYNINNKNKKAAVGTLIIAVTSVIVCIMMLIYDGEI